eukprot:6220646-Pyramimonas_sp.AAC.3
MFIDNEFPPNNRSLGPSLEPRALEWKRAQDINELKRTKKLALFEERIYPNYVRQVTEDMVA